MESEVADNNIRKDEELLNRCRKAASEVEFSNAVDAIIESVRQGRKLSMVTKESIVRSLLLEIPYRPNQEKLDRIFDGCGIVTTMSSVSDLIKEISTGSVLQNRTASSSAHPLAPTRGPLPISSVLQACFATIYRMLLLVPSSSSSPSESKALPLLEELQCENVRPFVQMIVLFPHVISNACHKFKLHPPPWAINAQYLPKLVAVAFVAAGEGESNPSNDAPKVKPSGSQIIVSLDDAEEKNIPDDDAGTNRRTSCDLYCSTLLRSMLCTLKGDHVSRGLKEQHPCGRKLVRLLLPNSGNPEQDGDDDDSSSCAYEFGSLDRNFLDTMLSPREFTSLIVSILQLYVATSGTSENDGSNSTASPSLQSCLVVLKASPEEHREAMVQSLIFSGKHNSRVGSIFIRLLNDAGYLYSHLCEIAEHWSQWTFVHEMERETTQRRVTNLILQGLDLLMKQEGDKRNDPAGDELTSSLLQGVTNRLDSVFPPIRRDGMLVGQALAKRLGQELQFDELKEDSGEETVVADNENAKGLGQNDKSKSKVASERQKRRRDKRRSMDPGALCESSDEEESDTDADDNADDSEAEALSSADDQSVMWNNELVPYDLEDPEEDLVETPRPLHLLEALELIRTADNDEHVYSNHETGLKYLPELIESRPDNLPDVGVSLLLSLLKMENKFNITNFLEMRQKAVTCLVIQEPRVVGITMVDELFKDSGLSDRLNILVALQEAAYELSGSKSLDDERKNPKQR